MAWTTPRTWADNELIDQTIMNTHVRDNLIALKSPPTSLHNFNEVSNYSTTSTSFADVDATNLALSITTTGGDVQVTFFGAVCTNAGTPLVHFDVDVDGARTGGDDGLISRKISTTSPSTDPIAFTIWIQGLSAASHTFKLQWKVSANTVTLFAGAGTASADLHPQFAVREG